MLRNPVTITPFAEEDMAAVQAITVKPFQKVFVEQSDDFLKNPEMWKYVHLIKKEGSVVGMFEVNTRFHHGLTFASSDTPSIRVLVIDQNKQGLGLGTEACRMMSFYLRGVVPLARGFYMLVHVNNAGAYKAITRAGWIDTKEKHNLGHKGLQHILWMPFR